MKARLKYTRLDQIGRFARFPEPNVYLYERRRVSKSEDPPRRLLDSRCSLNLSFI